MRQESSEFEIREIAKALVCEDYPDSGLATAIHRQTLIEPWDEKDKKIAYWIYQEAIKDWVYKITERRLLIKNKP